jgi:predicted transcriptional regulator
MYRRTWKKNERKRSILAVLARASGPMSYAQIGGVMGLYPLRQVATALTKYTRWGYIRRWKVGGKYRYEITRRGAERLAYLNRGTPGHRVAGPPKGHRK